MLECKWDDVGYSTIPGSTQEVEDEVLQHTLLETIHPILSTALFNAYSEVDSGSPEEISGASEVLLRQLREYIEIVAENYHKSPFHSFRHATQVVLNANHLVELAMTHPGTWAMSKAQAFCLLFAALIHDVDHLGLTNAYMIKENFNGLSTKYPDGSLAEHKSIDLSLALLKEPKFDALRVAICSLQFFHGSTATVPRDQNPDLSAFERMITTLLLSTDIMNPERTALSRSKWNQTFNSQSDTSAEEMDRKDETILELLLQLADVGHCAQRWETLILWNQRCLTEFVSAAANGKGIDPSDAWFKGQISFFDHYIIPLAERIRMGDIFSQDVSDIFLNSALRNKVRWNEEGAIVCDNMKEIAHREAELRLSALNNESGIDEEASKALRHAENVPRARMSMSSTAPSTAPSSENAYQPQHTIWSRLSNWKGGGDQQQDQSFWGAIIIWIITLPRHYRSGLSTMKRHPLIPLISIAAFVGLCTLGLFFVKYIDQSNKTERNMNALQITNDIGQSIKDCFEQALIPMYTLSQFIITQEIFHRLPDLIDNAPLKNGSTFRDVTGLCSADVNNYSTSFNQIARGLLYNSNLTMARVASAVFDIRAVPYGVHCLIYPNANSQVGNDLRLSKNAGPQAILKYTVLMDQLFILGPFSMGPSTPEVFCAHIPVNMPDKNYTFSYANSTRPSWGFIMMFFNWTKVKENIKLDEQFKAHDLGYNIFMNITGKPTIANSTSFASLKREDIVTSKIGTSYNEWIFEVGFLHRTRAYDNVVQLQIIVVLGSILITTLIMLTLITRQKHRDLLYKMMPLSAIKKIDRGDTVVEKFNLVTIFFCDIVGFTTMAGEMTPLNVMEMLNDLYIEFDKLTIKHKVYKVETIGDCFMAIGGAPDRCTGPLAGQKITLFALDVLKCVESFRTRQGDCISVRIGLASGSVVAGVVGDVMPRYCFFGDTVNFASRMESTSNEMKIQCSDLTHQMLLNAPDYSFICEERRSEGSDPGVFVKGKGQTHTWWVLGAKPLDAKEDP